MNDEFKKSVLENLVDADREIHFCCAGAISMISPKLSVGGQSSLKTDREHVESHLRSTEADVNCSTDRAGSPQTLIIAKTDASYQKKLVVYHEDQQKLTATIKAKEVLCQTN